MQLSLDEARRFNELFASHWHDWILSSPWRTDSFLTGRIPVGVVVRYGQNIQVCASDAPQNISQERKQWAGQRNWSGLRYFTFALATHIRSELLSSSISWLNISILRCMQAERLEPIPYEDVMGQVLQEEGAIYNDHDTATRREIPLAELRSYPVLDDS